MGQTDTKDDHHHWSDDEVHGYKGRPDGHSNAGYDDNNGLHRYTYYPAGASGAAPGHIQAPAPVYHQAPVALHPNPIYYGQSQWSAAGGLHWQTQIDPARSYTYFAPAHYSTSGFFQHVQPAFGHIPVYTTNDTYHALSAGEPAKPAMSNERTWVGRTKAQVNEDNMRIAHSEGAYGKREVAPVGLNNDQMVWVVETDGEYTLRAYATVKELKGTWKQDPRYESSWYFVREDESK